MSAAGTLLINGTDATPESEWDVTISRTTDGIGTMTVTIQDRTNNPDLMYGRQRDLVVYHIAGVPKFDGEIVGATLELPVGMPWRRWRINCTDWNTLLDTRLVGYPDGYEWEVDGITGQATPVDPNSRLGKDDVRIAAWFSNYVRTADFRTIDTSTAVNSYGSAGDTYVSGTTLRGALDQLRGALNRPVYYWISPPLTVGGEPIFHWTAFDPLP